MADPLASFRKAAILPASGKAVDPSPGDGEYLAFRAVDREPKCLSIYAGVAWVHENYAYLQYVAEDAGRGRRFSIVYGFMVVEVKGRNLRPVVEAIQQGNCAFIQEFDAAKWARPADTSEPLIDSVQFHYGAEKRGDMLAGKKTEEA